jgi:hypothetical protein
MGYSTPARWYEASSAALSTKCWNLHRNLYLLEDTTEEKNGVSVDFWLIQQAWRVSFLMHDWMIHNEIHAISSTNVVSNHYLSISLFKELLPFCTVVLATYLFTCVTTIQSPWTNRKHVLASPPLVNILLYYRLFLQLPTKRFLCSLIMW